MKEREGEGKKRRKTKERSIEHNAKNFPELIKSMNHHIQSVTDPTKRNRNKYRDPTMKSHKNQRKGGGCKNVPVV